MLHQEFWGSDRGASIRAEVERNRLEARLRKASKEREETGGGTLFSEGLSEELGTRKRNFLARGASFAAALFR